MPQPSLLAASISQSEQVAQKQLFAEPLIWVGKQPPAEAESGELLAVVRTFETNGVAAGFAGLEDFLHTHPESAWAPSLHVNMAEYYRLHGRYSLALEHWQAAWASTKDAQDAVAQKLAVRAIAGWTRLLASLGEKEKLNMLFKELGDRQLPLGVYATTINGTKEGLGMMNAKPGLSYRCGSFALGHMAMALGLDTKLCRTLIGVDSPDGGFHLSQLLELAQSNGLSVAAVRRPDGADLVVPAVVHWKLNHYAAITAKKGNLYRVEDPTFERHVWMNAETIEAEAGGEFILPQDKVPSGWQKLTTAECEAIYGKGYPSYMPDTEDPGPPDGCPPNGDDDSEDSSCDPPSPNDGAGGGGNPPDDPPCPDCGMPQWSVSEPYMTLWLKDTPLFYRQSSGKLMKLRLSYKSRGEAQNSTMGGFGDKWSCNWLGLLQSQSTNSDSVADYRAGGGVTTYQTDGTRNYRTASTLAATGSSGYMTWSPMNAQNNYGFVVGTLTGTTNYLLTQRTDRYGRILKQFNYGTVSGVTRMTNMLDMDGRTNTLTYGNGSFPNLITAVTDPYNRTAYFNYNGSGLLTNIVDAQGMSTIFQYDSDENITNMITLYGATAFQYYSGRDVSDGGGEGALTRSILITEASGDHQLYVYQDHPKTDFGDMASYHWNRAQFAAIGEAGKTNVLLLTADDCNNASVKHWLHSNNLQSDYPYTVSDTLGVTIDPYDPILYSRPSAVSYYYQGQSGEYLTDNAAGSLKRVTDILESGATRLHITRNDLGRPTSYTYYNSDGSSATYTNVFDASGTILLYELGPRGELTRGYGYDPVMTNLLVSVTNAENEVIRYTHEAGTLKVTSITFPGGLVRTNIYYTSGPNKGFLARQIDLGFRTNSFTYTNGNVWYQTNELGLVTTSTYDNLNRLTSTAFPDTTTVSNVYSKLDIVATKDRLNQWSYFGYNAVRQLMAATNVNGQVTTYDYCGCGSPDTIIRWNGTTPVTTGFYYDLGGRLTNAIYADGYQLFYSYDYSRQLQSVTDGGGNQLQLYYARHGLQNQLNQAILGGQQILYRQFDEYGRVTNNVDRNSVATAQSYDFLNRLATRQSFGNYGSQSGLESFAYDSRGLAHYTNQLGYLTSYGRDAAGRLLYETNANNEVLQFAYNPADELLTLTDGKNQITRWNYDGFGRVTNKVDATATEIFRYQYDPLDRLTNRWSAAKGNTVYKYDPLGNLTNVVYATATNVFRYDVLNRLTNMVDGIGSTAFGWTDGDQLAGENGPWASDTVGYSYNASRQRAGMSVLQPNASQWMQGYGYDAVMRLSQVDSPAGNFYYQYSGANDWALYLRLKDDWSLFAENQVDDLARQTSTALYTPFASPAAQFQYGYDAAFQRTQQVFTAGNYINYAYDKIGQLKAAQGFEPAYYDYNISDYVTQPRLHERFGYAYDAAWNLNRRTNNALVQTFTVNSLNELTNATRAGTLTVQGDANERKGGYWTGYDWYWDSPSGVTNVTVSGTGLSSGWADIYQDGSWTRTNATLADGANSYTAIARDNYGRADTNSVTVNLPASLNLIYDLNGNLRTNGTRILDYDEENELVRVTEPGAWKSEYAYDGLLRKRITREYAWQSSSWVKTNEVHYIYDGNLVVQERDTNNLPLVTYTRGDDLSHSLQGAGGIGGLLARTDNGQLTGGSPWATAYYFSDGNGNVMNLVYTNGLMAAQYTYDPYGNILTMSGPLATANKIRFSSKEWNDHAQLYYYGRRFYDPNLQRWVNRDPLGDYGSTVYLLPMLDQDIESDDTSGMTEDEMLNGFAEVNINLYGAVANSPINLIDALGYCSLAGGATPEGAEIIAEELGSEMETLAQAGARKAAEAEARKKAEEEALKKAAEAARKKEIQRVRDQENALNKLKDIQKAQDKVRKGQNEGRVIDETGKSEQNAKNLLKDIARDPSSCGE